MAKRKNTFTQGTPVMRRLKDLYDEAVTIMTDKALREKELQDAKKFKLDFVEKLLVDKVNNGGSIYKSDYKKMAELNKKWITADEIEKKVAYLKQQGAEIIDDTKTKLDFSTYDKIEKLLNTIGKSDLYSLLEESQNTPVGTLQSAIITTYNAAAGKTDYKSTAINQVCGEAKKVFKDDDAKKHYDVYLATKDIWDEVALKQKGGIAFISAAEFLAYSVRTKKALKISDLKEKKEFLAEGLLYFHITVSGGKKYINLEPCPHCGSFYNSDDNPKVCLHCSKPLEILCWNCGGKAPFTVKNKTCPSCGAADNHNARFDDVVKNIDNLLVQPGISINVIQTELNNLRNLLPDYKKISTSKLAKKVAEYQEKIEKKRKEEEAAGRKYLEELEKIKELIKQKKYYTASGEVENFKGKFPGINVSSHETQIKNALSQAQTAFANTKKLPPSGQADECLAILQNCADFRPAIEYLQSAPPEACKNLSVGIDDSSGCANISWQRSPGQSVSYRLVRKLGKEIPVNEIDGKVLTDNKNETAYRDNNILPGQWYSYAVFAVRYGVFSSAAGKSVILLADVTDANAEQIDKAIHLTWNNPKNCTGVTVYRTLNGKETTLINKAHNSYKDEDVQYDIPYSYKLCANYADLPSSRGVNVVITPMPILPCSIDKASSGFRKNNLYFKIDGVIPPNVAGFYYAARTEKSQNRWPAVGSIGVDTDIRRIKLADYRKYGEILYTETTHNEGTYFVSLFTIYNAGGKEIVSNPNPCRIDRPLEVKIFWEVSKPLLGNSKLSIEIKPSRPITRLPKLYLCTSLQGRHLLHYTDENAEVLMEIPEQELDFPQKNIKREHKIDSVIFSKLAKKSKLFLFAEKSVPNEKYFPIKRFKGKI